MNCILNIFDILARRRRDLRKNAVTHNNAMCSCDSSVISVAGCVKPFSQLATSTCQNKTDDMDGELEYYYNDYCK